MTELNRDHRNPAALAFACPKPSCQASPGTMCLGNSEAADGRYRFYIHAPRTDLLEMPGTREEWERRVSAIRASTGAEVSTPW